MELRHLRYFVAVGEELHFARAAERLHIEQSPLSRAIKDLENDLGVQLLERDPRGTRLTWAGQVLLEDVRRIFVTIEQARGNARAAAAGYRGMLRIALSDGIAPQRLAALLASCRVDDPEVDLKLFEVPLSVQCKGLRSDLYDIGFSRSNDVGNGIIASAAWSDRLVAVIPARHPLLAFKHVPLEEMMKYPLVLFHPEACEGFHRQVERLLQPVQREPTVAEYVASHDLMHTLVSAGYGVGFTCEAQGVGLQNSDVIVRPLAEPTPSLTTYILRPDAEHSEPLARFMERVLGSATGEDRDTMGHSLPAGSDSSARS